MRLLRTSGAGAAMQRCHEPAPFAGRASRQVHNFLCTEARIAKIYFSVDCSSAAGPWHCAQQLAGGLARKLPSVH